MNQISQQAALATFKRLEQRAKKLPDPLSTKIIKKFGRDPFLILISCLLSLRSRDTVTYPICENLFAQVKTPAQLAALPLEKIEKIIHSVNFYKRKAKLLHDVSRTIITRFNNKVPHTEKELLSIHGVGIKTANLVLAEAFKQPAICVDTHVHALANRLGWVKTKTPQQTQRALQELFPRRYWSKINPVLVKWGQNRCKETSSTCPVHDLCLRLYKKRGKN